MTHITGQLHKINAIVKAYVILVPLKDVLPLMTNNFFLICQTNISNNDNPPSIKNTPPPHHEYCICNALLPEIFFLFLH